MRLFLHIGPEAAGAGRIQQILDAKRDQLAGKGILIPRSPGARNHTRIWLATTDPGHVDTLRLNRGYASPQRQRALQSELIADLEREISQSRPQSVIVSVAQLADLHRVGEVQRLRDLLAPLCDDIRIVAFAGDPASLMLRHYALQLGEGRAVPLSRELRMAADTDTDWWQACRDAMGDGNPLAGRFEEVQGPPVWLDYAALRDHWEAVFGAGSLSFHGYDRDAFDSDSATDLLRSAFDIPDAIGRAPPAEADPLPSAPTLARARLLNEMLLKYLADGNRYVPRQLWHRFIAEVAIDGPAPDPGGLAALSRRFGEQNRQLAGRHTGLGAAAFVPPAGQADWAEADPDRGFRASQYLLWFRYRIDKATREKHAALQADLAGGADGGEPGPAAAPAEPSPATDGLSAQARAVMPPLAIEKFHGLKSSAFAPHNRLGAVDENQLAAAYDPVPARQLPAGSSGNVIVGCMKNEAPYILEWVAFHRAIGVDNFLIYTNGCEDGTDEILGRLQEMGLLQHRLNDDWKGNSPQQFALNRALREPVIENADWIIHIDVDEFINVRTGNGTLADFFAAVPDATNVAMTWRLFGHNDITRFRDDLVIEQFDRCAPKFCPKPHTVWGFKTMFKNIGAYAKMSCHRPNKLDESLRNKVRWVNGSGHDMTAEALENGWRNSKKSIGYDLLQLNHYALRSAESFLIKRQRGRALHVDRSIGLNYWIRMDWCDYRDITIKRNLPRLRAEYDRLLDDETLRGWHDRGLAWHRAKAEELHAMPEFANLYRQALNIKLTETERVAYALALDLES